MKRIQSATVRFASTMALLCTLNTASAADFKIETELAPLNLVGTGQFQLTTGGDLYGSTWKVQQAPGTQSKATTLIHELPSGEFAVDSFFDVFAEISLDGLAPLQLPPLQFHTVPQTIPAFDPFNPNLFGGSAILLEPLTLDFDIPHTFSGSGGPVLVEIELLQLQLTPASPPILNSDHSVDSFFTVALTIGGDINPPFSISLFDLDPLPLHSSPPVQTPEGMPALFAPAFLFFLMGAAHLARQQSQRRGSPADA